MSERKCRRRRSAKCSSKLKACKKRLAELSESTDESGISEAPAVENSTVKSVGAVKNNSVETVEKSGRSGIIVESENSHDNMGTAHIEKINDKKHIKTYKLDDYNNIWSQTYSSNAKSMAEFLNAQLSSGKFGSLDRVIIAKNSSLGGVAAYDYVTNSLFISEELADAKRFFELVDSQYFAACSLDDVITHELSGHKAHWDAVKRFYHKSRDKYSSFVEAKIAFETRLDEYVQRQRSFDPYYIAKYVSMNASMAFYSKALQFKYNELFADIIVRQSQNRIEDGYLFDIIKEMLRYDETP